MINDIGLQLKKQFHDIKIYREQKAQGFEAPAFFVHEVFTDHKDELMDYQFVTKRFAIMYFPQSEMESKEECEKIGNELVTSFTFLESCKCKVMNRTYEIVDNTTQFLFNVRYRIVLDKEEGTLQSLEDELKGELYEG